MTKTEIKNLSNNIICIPYCNAQNLLSVLDRIGFNAGVYGWNYDVYYVYNTVICTGYRGMPGVKAERKTLEKYETAAQSVRRDASLSYDEIRIKINTLLYEFVKEVTKKDGYNATATV